MSNLSTKQIESDIEARIYSYSYPDIIKNIFSKNNFPYQFISDYVNWNSIFVGGVSSLSSRFHLWPYIGEDISISNPLLFDSSIEIKNKSSHKIAGYIFSAAEDEYNELGCKIKDERVCHKDMAWVFLKKIYEGVNVKFDTRKVSPFVSAANKEVLKGYGVDQPINFNVLAENLGFHIASEKLASVEFSIIYNLIKDKYPGLFEYLEKSHCDNIYGIEWLKIHGEIEVKHYNNALQAAVLILNPYHCSTIESLQNGFKKFVDLQCHFFKYYLG